MKGLDLSEKIFYVIGKVAIVGLTIAAVFSGAIILITIGSLVYGVLLN